MAASQSEICNIALTKVGSESYIVDLNQDNTKSARLFRVIYDSMRDSLLRSHLWRFARKRAVLAPLAGAVPFEGGYYFQLPNDCLRVVGTDEVYTVGYGKWYVEGDKIVAETDVFNLVYIARIEDTGLYDPIFAEALATKLAHAISLPIAQSETMKRELAAELRELTIKAAHVGATEQDSSKFIAETFIQAHT